MIRRVLQACQLEILFANELPKEHVSRAKHVHKPVCPAQAAVSFTDHDQRLLLGLYGVVDVIFVTFLMK